MVHLVGEVVTAIVAGGLIFLSGNPVLITIGIVILVIEVIATVLHVLNLLTRKEVAIA